MANPISRTWRKLFYHDSGGYFLLPEVDSAQPEPMNEGPFGDAGPQVVGWFNRWTYGDRVATPLFYTAIGVLLAILTVLEVWFFTLDDGFGAFFVPMMLLLALAKFVIVVAFFMHLRFDKNLLTLIFASGFVISIAVFMIVLSVQDKVNPAPLVAP
ncbi:MAG: cytochrome C oxidase subunit IV family protein [Dehalococcoidia bacterium]|jgi:cytochrome c oxidase subunit 4|nr:cytochrome C oxidase subunit IV family protein [Dehalococcoidia bacterium]